VIKLLCGVHCSFPTYVFVYIHLYIFIPSSCGPIGGFYISGPESGRARGKCERGHTHKAEGGARSKEVPPRDGGTGKGSGVQWRKRKTGISQSSRSFSVVDNGWERGLGWEGRHSRPSSPDTDMLGDEKK